MIEHIRAFGEYRRTHGEFGKPVDNPQETNEIIQFADFLHTFTAAGRVVSVVPAQWLIDFAAAKRELDKQKRAEN